MTQAAGSVIRSALKKVPLAGVFIVGAGIYDYHHWRSQGYSAPMAGLRAGAETALYTAFPPLIFASIGAQLAPLGYTAGRDFIRNQQMKLRMGANMGRIGSGYFTDSRAAFTMRQQGTRAIQESFSRVAYGNEARMMYRR